MMEHSPQILTNEEKATTMQKVRIAVLRVKVSGFIFLTNFCLPDLLNY